MFSVSCVRSLRHTCFLLAAMMITCSGVGHSTAQAAEEMKPYVEKISDSDITFEMLPIPGGKFTMGSPASEKKRKDDEGPTHEVEISPFWMGKFEVTWDEYEVFMFQLDIARRSIEKREPNALDKLADACSKPTKPYTDMTFGMGKEKFPAICMTQYAATRYCEWLSAKTGKFYRLPTEAEWEYACRAGTKTAYSFGDDASAIGDYAWYYDNSDEKYQQVGKKKPNPWGLYDMHGNVAEWVLDQHDPAFYGKQEASEKDPVLSPKKVEPCVVRGGSWNDDPELLRSAVRVGSTNDWKQQDPQVPQSIWYYTDALFVGFRVVRPLDVPPVDVQKKVYSGGPPE